LPTSMYPILMAAVLGGWAFLSLLGGERARLLEEAEMKAAREAEDARIAAAIALRHPEITPAKPATASAPKLPTPPQAKSQAAPAKSQPAPAKSKR
jgi:hypothetical protein